MIQLSNLNKALILVYFIFSSCGDDNVNYAACSPSQILDSCGQCYNSDNDDGWNSCLDACNIQYGENTCDLNGILDGDCECAGCWELGDPNYCDDCEFEDQCACSYDLQSIFHVNIIDCIDSNSCGNQIFDKNNLTFIIRERCGLLININANYTIESLENIIFNDPSGELISMNYFDDTNYNADINDGCDLPINTIYITNNGDVYYNASDDINYFEFSLYNHCQNENSGFCETVQGCSWNGTECALDQVNSIGGGVSSSAGFSLSSNFIISGSSQGNVIPDEHDYINSIIFYNKNPNNTIYIKWTDVIISTDYIPIEPLGAFGIVHNNWFSSELGNLIIDNDNLTIFPNSLIEAYIYINNNYVKYGDLGINLNFKSPSEILEDESRPEYCFSSF